jgi:superfamily II DNA helicase RecQ
VFRRYGIKTLEINEDTPNDEWIWKVSTLLQFSMLCLTLYSLQGISDQLWRALIVTVEQLSLYKGHLPRFARLIRQDRSLLSKFKLMNIDEAHFLYMTGIRKHGQPAFRPAYGVLDSVRLLFKNITVSAHSATLPPHMLKVTINKLSMPSNLVNINVSSNRPNLVYATRRLVGPTSNYNNLNCLIPAPYYCPMLIQKGVVFFDKKAETSDAAMHLNARLPKELRDLGIVRHYHGGMSKLYLQETYDDFCDPNGTCRILCATSAASTVSHFIISNSAEY